MLVTAITASSMAFHTFKGSAMKPTSFLQTFQHLVLRNKEARNGVSIPGIHRLLSTSASNKSSSHLASNISYPGVTDSSATSSQTSTNSSAKSNVATPPPFFHIVDLKNKSPGDKSAKVSNHIPDAHGPRPSFFDHQSTTPLDPRVLDKMLPLMTSLYGNPHSRSHPYGWEAEELVEEARGHVAKLLNCQPKNIIFTSGATESNNMSIKGLASYFRESQERARVADAAMSAGDSKSSAAVSSQKRKNHIITTQIEHKCVLQSCRHLEEFGWDITYLPVDQDGLIDLKSFEDSIRPETLMASVMMVNNEIGVIQDIKEIGKICKKHKIYFHTDAAQGYGKIPLDVDDMSIDLLSISGHKIYGPKGIGALYVRSKPRVRLSPLIDGGGQERGFRSGTLAPSLVVGLGEAARVAAMEMKNDEKWITKLSQRLVQKIEEQLSCVKLNGHPSKRYQGNVNLSFEYVEGESLLMSISNVAISSGSACTSASLEPSYVLRALGVGEEMAHTSLRFGIGRFTTEHEVDECVDTVVREVKRLREMSPLMEMAMEAKASGKQLAKPVWT